MNPNRDSGQTLVEFALCLPIVTGAVLGAYLVLKQEWKRANCSHLLFERAHAELISSGQRHNSVRQASWYRSSETEQSLHAVGTCGGQAEHVILNKLK